MSIGEINSIERTARIFGVNTRMIADLFRAGELSGVKVGRETLFTRAAIEEYVAHHTLGGLDKDGTPAPPAPAVVRRGTRPMI